MAAAGSVDESTNGPEVFSELREQLVQIAVLFASLGEKEQKETERETHPDHRSGAQRGD